MVSVCLHCYKPIYRYTKDFNPEQRTEWFHFNTYIYCDKGQSKLRAEPSSAFVAKVMDVTKEQWEEWGRDDAGVDKPQSA